MIPFVVGAMLLQTVRAAPPAVAAPFSVGETLEFSGKYLFATPGSATMVVTGIDTVRGVPQWHFNLALNVDFAWFHNKSRLESWTTVGDFVSRRFIHSIVEQGKQLANDDFHIYGDSGFYRNHSDTLTKKTPKLPLDDLAFIYYLRTMEFKQDSTYRMPRYFRDDHNPVEVTVLGHDSVEMPDGTKRSCWVLHPVVDEPNGLFSRKSDAKLWLTDDGLRLPVQIESKLFVSHLTLKIVKISYSR